eukprot:TCALIF_09019-PB protein Name:"Protein of unknown function" AED:0.11 eAED:0.12 QI:206/0.75/0.66/1/1/1/9/985/816
MVWRFLILLWSLFSNCSVLAQEAKTSVLMQRSSLEKYDLAQCNDGSTAAYFYDQDDAAKGNAKILIYLPDDAGTRECSTAQGCQLKCQENPQRCTSNERPSIQMDDGIWSQDKRNNPFADHFKVLLPSCSSDEFGGTRGRSDETGGMIFHGRHIFSSLLRDMVANHNMGKAQEIVLVGSGEVLLIARLMLTMVLKYLNPNKGSGARGAARNCDFLANAIKTVNENTKVRCVLDGVDLVPYWVQSENCFEPKEKPEAQKYLWDRQDDESCIEENKDKVNSTELANLCGAFSRSWKHIKTPVFLTSNQLDETNFDEQTCGVASDAEDFRDFSVGWRQGMLAMAEALSVNKPENGWFIPNCDDATAFLDNEHAALRREVRIPLLTTQTAEEKSVNVLQAINNWLNKGSDHQAIDAFGVPNDACSAVKSLPLDLRPDLPLKPISEDARPAPIRAGSRRGPFRSRFNPPSDLFPAGNLPRTDYIGEADDYLFDYDEFSLGQDYDYALDTGLTPGVAAALDPLDHPIVDDSHHPVGRPVHRQPVIHSKPYYGHGAKRYPGRVRHTPGRRVSLWRRLYYLEYLKKLYNRNYQQYADEYYGTAVGPNHGYHGKTAYSKGHSFPRHPAYTRSGYGSKGGGRRRHQHGHFARIQAKDEATDETIDGEPISRLVSDKIENPTINSETAETPLFEEEDPNDQVEEIKLCYECGGKTDKNCAEFSATAKFEVICNSTASGSLEQKLCWTRDSNTCDSPIPGQLRVCSCKGDLCNCFADTGNAALTEECPSAPFNAELRSSSPMSNVLNGEMGLVLFIGCLGLCKYLNGQ